MSLPTMKTMNLHTDGDGGGGQPMGVGGGQIGGGLAGGDLVGRLTKSILDEPRMRHLGATHLPSRETVGEAVELLRELVFPGFFTRRGLTPENLSLHVQEVLARVTLHLEEQIRAVLRYVEGTAPASGPGSSPGSAPGTTPTNDAACETKAREVARKFLDELPEIRRLLALDVQAAYDGDPAAVHTDETIFCYPGVDAIFSHRIAHTLYRMNVPLLPRIIQEMAHSRTGIDIHPGARIGESFFIDHGGAVVIGETTKIGHHVRIYQGVTLGAKSFQKDPKGRLVRDGRQRHPTIGNRVTIYAGAVILGGETVIGDDCVIAGSVLVTESVAPGHMVRQLRPELVMRSHADIKASREAWADYGAFI